MMSKKEFLSLHDWLKLQGGLTEEEVKAFEERSKARARWKLLKKEKESRYGSNEGTVSYDLG